MFQLFWKKLQFEMNEKNCKRIKIICKLTWFKIESFWSYNSRRYSGRYSKASMSFFYMFIWFVNFALVHLIIDCVFWRIKILDKII